MTTNNHPAHGPVSLDRLHQIREILSKAAAQSDGGNLGYAIADAVKVIDEAIAAFGAEPAPVDIEMLATVLRNAPLAPSDSQGKPRAPVVPEVMANPDESQYGGAGDEDYRAEYAYVEGWNACRAAMLQGADQQQNAQQNIPKIIPFEQWLSQQTGAIDVDCGCVTTEAFFHWLRVAYEAGNSPVIPDCWCHTCRPVTMGDMRFVVCPECGNKRCPHANDHRHACTGSNEPSQEGSAYPAAPQQEVK